MKIAGTALKELVKKLGVLASDQFVFGEGAAFARVQNLDLKIVFPWPDIKPFSVSAQKFSQIIARLDGEIDLTVDEAKLHIRVKKSRLSLPIIACEVPKVCSDMNNSVEIKYDTLQAALNFVQQATRAGDEFQHSYHGAVQLSDKYAAASDGQRLAFAEMSTGLPTPLLIPQIAVSALKALSGAVTVGENQNNIVFKTKQETLVVRKLAKTFPAWERLIPASTKHIIEFNADELRTALRTIAPISNERILLTNSGEFIIITVNEVTGSADLELSAAKLVNADPVFADKLSYFIRLDGLMDYVESVKDRLTLGIDGPNSPAFLQSGSTKLILAAQRQ